MDKFNEVLNELKGKATFGNKTITALYNKFFEIEIGEDITPAEVRRLEASIMKNFSTASYHLAQAKLVLKQTEIDYKREYSKIAVRVITEIKGRTQKSPTEKILGYTVDNIIAKDYNYILETKKQAEQAIIMWTYVINAMNFKSERLKNIVRSLQVDAKLTLY